MPHLPIITNYYIHQKYIKVTQINGYLEHLNLLQMIEQTQQALNEPITFAEIQEAVDDIPSGKAAGPEGFPPEIYKEFKDVFLFLSSVKCLNSPSCIKN